MINRDYVQVPVIDLFVAQQYFNFKGIIFDKR